MDFKELVKFTEFLSAFAGIKRANKIKGKEDFENDAEHSYQLALVAWYISDALNLNLNKESVLKYALAHDLVEVYAGDTDSFKQNSTSDTKSKHEREAQALIKIKNEFPTFSSLYEIIEKYEALVDRESKLVYIVDKLLPDINIYLSGDTCYKDNKVTRDGWEKWFREKVARSGIQDKEILAFVDQLIEFQRGQEVFYQ